MLRAFGAVLPVFALRFFAFWATNSSKCTTVTISNNTHKRLIIHTYNQNRKQKALKHFQISVFTFSFHKHFNLMSWLVVWQHMHLLNGLMAAVWPSCLQVQHFCMNLLCSFRFFCRSFSFLFFICFFVFFAYIRFSVRICTISFVFVYAHFRHHHTQYK